MFKLTGFYDIFLCNKHSEMHFLLKNVLFLLKNAIYAIKRFLLALFKNSNFKKYNIKPKLCQKVFIFISKIMTFCPK